jgi:hypothetical protein
MIIELSGSGAVMSPACCAAAVAPLITGAGPETGFGGIGPGRRFGRRDLLHFEAPIDGLMALRRRDNYRGVILDLNMSVVPAAREM